MSGFLASPESGCLASRLASRNRVQRVDVWLPFRISTDGCDQIIDADQVEAIEPAIRSSEPGRYHLYKISADPLPGGHTSRRWGCPDHVHRGHVAMLAGAASASRTWHCRGRRPRS